MQCHISACVTQPNQQLGNQDLVLFSNLEA